MLRLQEPLVTWILDSEDVREAPPRPPRSDHRSGKAAESRASASPGREPLSVPCKLGGSLKQAKTHKSRYRITDGPKPVRPSY